MRSNKVVMPMSQNNLLHTHSCRLITCQSGILPLRDSSGQGVCFLHTSRSTFQVYPHIHRAPPMRPWPGPSGGLGTFRAPSIWKPRRRRESSEEKSSDSMRSDLSSDGFLNSSRASAVATSQRSGQDEPAAVSIMCAHALLVCACACEQASE